MKKIKQWIVSNRLAYFFSRKVIDEYGNLKLNRFIKKYSKNPEGFIASLKKQGKYKIIRHGKYNYRTFSAFYLNNMLGLILKSLMDGYIPVVKNETISEEEKSNNWEDFFCQPFGDANSSSVIDETNRNNIYKPAFDYIYDDKKKKLWSYIYNEFIKFNQETENYINDEYNRILKGKKVLGIICRGTDYTKTKPKYHPIQPNIEEIIAEADKLMNSGKYTHLYVATEDETYFNMFVDKFGKDRVLSNSRKYYDTLYAQMDENALLFSVKFDRENDQYMKGKEYLSSMILLSRCDALIGGHCGGSDMAIYFNNCKYDYLHIFDCGVY